MQEKIILRLSFNPRLALTGFRTTRPRKILLYNQIKTKLNLPQQCSCLPTVSCHTDCEYYSEIKTISWSHFFNRIQGAQGIVPRCL